MIKAQIQRGDGMASGRQWLESVVRSMQLALIDADLLSSADGKFGSGTEKQLIRFQRSHDLHNNLGLADKQTWQLLQPHLDNTVGRHEAKFREFLQSFRGDLEWIHAREGHLGKPYWPGGASGITLDPGVDLGHVPLDCVEDLYSAC